MGETRGGKLSLHYSTDEKASASHQVFLEELGDDIGEVGDVHLGGWVGGWVRRRRFE